GPLPSLSWPSHPWVIESPRKRRPTSPFLARSRKVSCIFIHQPSRLGRGAGSVALSGGGRASFFLASWARAGPASARRKRARLQHRRRAGKGRIEASSGGRSGGVDPAATGRAGRGRVILLAAEGRIQQVGAERSGPLAEHVRQGRLHGVGPDPVAAAGEVER